jgi:hypothetical protein
MPAIDVFEAWGGEIREIEAAGWTARYRIRTCSERSRAKLTLAWQD